ncbi:MAG: hypothetical protein BWX80_01821 [Candidatus Hydrogenedentes bacterium ADurb.Bin101]|nr:MAG: hypothetical protein BWX80_01821 [Candidatus Hydrogenedentes bacterium ADurb.Bin101]HOC68647.1 hypothetical protein [Candidatus Hydrogenedentota bacterium]
MFNKTTIFALALVLAAAASMTFWPQESSAAPAQAGVCCDKCPCPEGKCECGEACTEACRKACAASGACPADKSACTADAGSCASKQGKACPASGKACTMTPPRTACCAR